MKSLVKIPTPLIFNQEQLISTKPTSTTAKFEKYIENRTKALNISAIELRKIPEKKREKNVYKYLTLDEIWFLKDGLKKVLPVKKIFVTNEIESKHVTVEDFIFYDKKRQEYKKLSSDELKTKTKNEIEYYFQFLTPNEILEEIEKIRLLNIKF